MKLRSFLLGSICAAGLFASNAFAVPIDYFTSSVTTSDVTQLGRLSRNNTTPQTWTHQETFPGVISPSTTYYYKTYTYAASQFAGTPYVELSVYDETNSGQFFLSAYANSYNPNDKQANWLGDAASSGNYTFFAGLPGDARYFDVYLPTGDSLVLLVNTTGGGTAGTNLLYYISVDAFGDTQYGPAITPEPSTFIELGTGMLAVVGVVRRRLRVA